MLDRRTLRGEKLRQIYQNMVCMYDMYVPGLTIAEPPFGTQPNL